MPELSSSEKIIHVLPPGAGGVNDFVDLLCAANDRFSKHSLSEEGASRWAFSGDVVLHYVGYGYAKRGAPLWLLNKLRRERRSIRKLVVWFHELYAFGTPLGSAFWLSPVQRYIAAELMKLCDAAVTNRKSSAKWLSKYSDAECSVLPVPSNVGECADQEFREEFGVVFGGRHQRVKLYRAWLPFLSRMVSRGVEVVDIGPPVGDSLLEELIRDSGIKTFGMLPSDSVSALLARARFGFVDYKFQELSKSGIFAAYAAHGVCPVIPLSSGASEDGLVSGKNFIVFDDVLGLTKSGTEQVGRNAFNWYRSHDANEHVKLILSVFQA